MSNTTLYKKIIDKTVKYYSKNPLKRRSIAYSYCLYFAKYEDGHCRMCAVGRYLKDPEEVQKAIYKLNSCGEMGVNVLINTFGEKVFKKKYRNINIAFWVSLQDLHDGNIYWNENGLSKAGENKVKDLYKTFVEIEKC
jgi:hypothetical protein